MKFLFAGVLIFSLSLSLPLGDKAWAQSGLTISKLDARLFQGPEQSRRDGLLNLTGMLNDNSTDGELIDNLVAGTVTIEVDAGTGFSFTATISGCTRLASHPGARCKADLPGDAGRYKFQARRYRNTPNVFRIDLRARRLDGSITGSDSLAGPATVTITQTNATRDDTLSVAECTAQRSGGFLRCRAD
ncbi:MAG: hypothetical protein P8K76_07705 [Candidatus Binatia bacterium]|nr:hypothetical protein [Candidatus Binatia bacterium]MDG2009650.1 hypothetical protein [Candidatus Binatia bacterium]